MPENVSGTRYNTAQLRSARALLGWSQRKMAHETGLPLSVVQRGEAPISARNIDSNDFMRCIEALEGAGIFFIWLKDDFDDDCIGVLHYDRPPGAPEHRKPKLRLVVDND